MQLRLGTTDVEYELSARRSCHFMLFSDAG